MWKHSIGTCCLDMPLDPESFINSQADIVVKGILATPEALPIAGSNT
jgi:hypothetical protein